MKAKIGRPELTFFDDHILPNFELPRGRAVWGPEYELGLDEFAVDFKVEDRKFRLFGADFLEDSDIPGQYQMLAAEARLEFGTAKPVRIDASARQKLRHEFIYLIKDPEEIAHLIPAEPDFQRWGMVHVDKHRPQAYKYIPVYLDRFAIFEVS